MSPELLSCRNPAYARNLQHFQYPSMKKVELQGQTLLIPSICKASMQQSSSDSSMLRDTPKYTLCTTNFLLIQGKILGLAPSMATAYFHYTRTYFCIQNSHSLDCRTHDKPLCINNEDGLQPSFHVKMVMKHSTLYPLCKASISQPPT